MSSRAKATRNNTSGGPDSHKDTVNARYLSMLVGLVEPLGLALPTSSEVVLHDLARIPNSIIAVHGDVTGRKVGDPATDMLLENATSGNLENMIDYRTRLPDGRELRSTTIIVRDGDDEPIAALCVNSDTTVWKTLGRIVESMGVGPGSTAGADDPVSEDPASGVQQERFARNVDELAAHLVHQAIADQGVPIELMRKEHKIDVVRILQSKGMFALRDAVEMIASSLQVTRFTIYNYLNEIGNDAVPDEHARSRTKRKN